MGAAPSRECTSVFSYFRGSYEVGMVPLTKHYFGKDNEAAEANEGASLLPSPSSFLSPPHPDKSRRSMRYQLRQQLLLMRRDPAVLYANAREAESVLRSIAKREEQEKASLAAEEEPVLPTSAEGVSSATAGADLRAKGNKSNSDDEGAVTDADQQNGGLSDSKGYSLSSPSPPQQQPGDSNPFAHSREEQLQRNYWKVMPEENFTEEDLDRFLDLVDATLFDSNEALLAEDPIYPTATGTHSKPFVPVPCALCLAYPDGKERDGAFTLDGRVVNIIGYFGLMTREMQDAFKVVKRLPSASERKTAEMQQSDGQGITDASAAAAAAAAPQLYLNTAILTSAGDRTLERVLVLAAVMLRQQFHTIARRHLLQAKLNQLHQLMRAQPLSVDPQMLHYLQVLLALPVSATAEAARSKTPYFDPLLKVPLPGIPSGIYTPTHFVNAACADPSAQQQSRVSTASSLGGGGGGVHSTHDNTHKSYQPPGGAANLSGCAGTAVESGPSASACCNMPCDGSPFLTVMGSSGSGQTLLFPQAPLSSDPGNIWGTNNSAPGSVSTCALRPHESNGGSPMNSHPLIPPAPAAGALPLSQGDEDAITLALCRRMEQVCIIIETASNNYSALKSLTENFAFLHCQILLDRSLTTMELVELPPLRETPSFKPAPFAVTSAMTIGDSAEVVIQTARADHEEEMAEGLPAAADAPTSTPSAEKEPALHQLPPCSAVLLKLHPLLVRQATMWASSFFHCPTLLPSGGWVKYKLKDECEQLRHVLQNKDTYIALWRKSDVEHASHYLGTHTARLLEHVRALQAETEEARALPAEYWQHQPLYVNQDGRKYALYQSRYGTMLIGVRAFTLAAGSAGGAAAGVKEERSSGPRGGGNHATSGTSIPLGNAAHTGFMGPTSIESGPVRHTSSRNHSNNNGANGVTNATLSGAPAVLPNPPVFLNPAGPFLNSEGASGNNNSNGLFKYAYPMGGVTNHAYPAYSPALPVNANGGVFVPAPFMAPQMYMNSGGGALGYVAAGPHFGNYPEGPHFMMGVSRPGEGIQYGAPLAATSASYPMGRMMPGYSGPPPPLPPSKPSGYSSPHGDGVMARCADMMPMGTTGVASQGQQPLQQQQQQQQQSPMTTAFPILPPMTMMQTTSTASPQDTPAQSSAPFMKAVPPQGNLDWSRSSPHLIGQPMPAQSYAIPTAPMQYQQKLLGAPDRTQGFACVSSHPMLFAQANAYPPAGTTSSNTVPMLVTPVQRAIGEPLQGAALSPLTAPARASNGGALGLPPTYSNSGDHQLHQNSVPAANGTTGGLGSTQISEDVGTALPPSEVATKLAAAPVLSNPHGCVGMGREDVTMSDTSLAHQPYSTLTMPSGKRSSCDSHLSKAADANTAADEERSPRTVLQSLLPWSLQCTENWGSAEENATNTTQFLLRSTELLYVDDDDAKRVAAVSEDDVNTSDCSLGGTAAFTGPRSDHTSGATRVTKLMANWDKLVVATSSQSLQSPSSEKVDMSVMNMLLTGPLPPPSDTASSASSPWQVALPAAAERQMTGAVPQPTGQTQRTIPATVVHMLQQQQQQQQQQAQLPPPQQQQQPQVTMAPQLQAAATGNRIFYTIANGVPYLVQPAAAPGGMAIAYPLGQSVAQGNDAAQQCHQAPPPQPTQLQQLQQQQEQQQQQHFAAPMHFSVDLSSAAAGGFLALPGKEWGEPYRALPRY